MLKVTTTPKTNIQSIQNLETVKTNFTHINKEDVICGTILHASICNKKCSSCLKPIQETDIVTSVTKCGSCHMKQRNETLEVSCHSCKCYFRRFTKKTYYVWRWVDILLRRSEQVCSAQLHWRFRGLFPHVAKTRNRSHERYHLEYQD